MNTRFYVPRHSTLPAINWKPRLDEARRMAHAIASRGVLCEVLEVVVSGPDTEVLLGLHEHMRRSPDALPESEYFKSTIYEVHTPGDQIPLPGDEIPVYDVVVERFPADKPKSKSGRQKAKKAK